VGKRREDCDVLNNSKGNRKERRSLEQRANKLRKRE